MYKLEYTIMGPNTKQKRVSDTIYGNLDKEIWNKVIFYVLGNELFDFSQKIKNYFSKLIIFTLLWSFLLHNGSEYSIIMAMAQDIFFEPTIQEHDSFKPLVIS